nr:MAG TPA: cobalamin biosynthesis protein [Caudoviricetes sp.]
MAKKQLKKRIFVPTGNDLGEFTIFDLQPVDITFVDSDDSSQSQDSNKKMGSSQSSIPDPVDNNPLNKGSQDNSSSSDGGNGQKDENPYATNNGNNNNSDDFAKQDRDINNDLYGEDLDTDSGEQPPQNSDGGDGEGSAGDGESGSGSSGVGGSDDNSFAPPNYDSSSNMGDDNSSVGNTTSEMEDALNKEQDNMSDTAKERMSEVSGQSNNSSSNENGSQGDNSQGEDGSSSDSKNSQSGDKDGSLSNNSQGENGSSGDNSQNSNSQEGNSSSSGGDSKGGSGNNQSGKSDNDFKKAHDTKGNDLDDTKGKEVVEKMVREASKRMQEEIDKDETLADTNKTSLDNYKDFGAGTMTTLFKGNSMVADWKAKLEKLFRKALGQRITMNPNMINKRIEDAPPGREDIETQMIKVAVLIDCSGSMGNKTVTII